MPTPPCKLLFRMPLQGQGGSPWKLVTDQLGSYVAAHGELGLRAIRRTGRYENDRAEVSHQHARERERQVRHFKSARGFRFRLENPVSVEEESDSGGVRVRGGTCHSIEASGELMVINHPHAYPMPPSGIQITPNIRTMLHRYLGYRENKEPLASMAYFCLTVLNHSVAQLAIENSNGTANPSASYSDVQEWFGVSSNVYSRLRKLSSRHGGQEARKAEGMGKDLKPEERRFLEEGIKRIIRRMAETTHDPSKPLGQITLADLPPLG